jgi:hypothetical protein
MKNKRIFIMYDRDNDEALKFELEMESNCYREQDARAARIQDRLEQEQKELDGKNARIKDELITKLIEALKISAITNENGEALMPWTDELIEELLVG